MCIMRKCSHKFALITADRDYIPVSQKITFLPGQSKVIVNIQILDDTFLHEPSVYFWVDVIFNRITIARSTVTIFDNDHACKFNSTCMYDSQF